MSELLMGIPTESLVDMLVAILRPEMAPSAFDGAIIEQIQCELHRRGEHQKWIFAPVN